MADIASRLDWTAWAGIGVLGVLVFLVGVYQPALAALPFSSWVSDAVAVAGAVVAVVGVTYAMDRRKEEQKRPRRLGMGESVDRSIAPSLEVYDPRIADDPEPEPTPALPPR